MKTGRLALLLILGIFVLTALNLSLGSVSIPLKWVFAALTGNEDTPVVYANILMKSRLPQTITAALAGAGLSIAGLLMQTLFRNPLAGPSVLGISSGASLGVAAVVLLAGAGGLMGMSIYYASIIAAFVGAFVVLLLISYFSARLHDNAMLLIIGLMLGYITSSLVGVLNFYATSENVHSYTLWGLGSFSGVGWSQMPLFSGLIVVGLMISLGMPKWLNMLLLGDRYASNLGLRVPRARLAVIIVAGVLTAAVTAFCGPIAFLGIAVPQVSRFLVGRNEHTVLLPITLLTGMFIALLCNLIARLPGLEGALPINAVTSFMGAPIVIWVILDKRRQRITI
ncbi:iron ABC transporter permease [Williamwhitmania taraxaci]|uniref:Iron complex transport system permease protein n=1 Tax=Williamwhitmania taraxaci TaxID=1640674 RepID=A0A1G6RLR9_9BACT|nr:iron ABC transporter permease [Williamwhitmania taraxaci]SDD04935.1 iron complex transport system permease protein [Williamwhitmania taraxaci]